MTLLNITRRTAFRMALSFATLFVAAMGLIFAALYALITNDIEKKLTSGIAETQSTLVAVSEKDGAIGLKAILDTKRPPAPENEEVYLLVDKDGKYLAGNILSAPKFDGWQRLEWDKITFKSAADDYEGTDDLLAKWVPLVGGSLLVGDGNNDVVEAQNLLVEGLIWGFALTLLSGVLGGLWLGRRAQRRIDGLESALDAVAGGRLDTRVPLSKANDDLEHVAEKINVMLGRLQGAVTTLGQVSSDIAHDLKTPIGRINQKLDGALQTARTAGEYHAAIEDARGDLDGVVATFEALLRIAQIEGGARKARFKPTNLRDVMSDAAEAYGVVAEDAGHKLVARPRDWPDVFVSGDRELLTQQFANLIENCIRHCPRGASISIDLKSEADFAVARVCDDGPGIPEEERGKVFRRLYRLDKSRSTPGNGLGLSLVAAIAALHDAKIELGDNAPGLAVKIKFPLEKRQS